MVTARLPKETEWQLEEARMVKARIEKTTLGQITDFVEEVYSQDEFYLLLKLDINLIKTLKLQVDNEIAKWCILDRIKPKLKPNQIQVPIGNRWLKIMLDPEGMSGSGAKSKSKVAKVVKSPALQLQELKKKILEVSVSGINEALRAAIVQLDGKEADASDGSKQYKLLIEGTGLDKVMAIYGVDWKRSYSNNVIEVWKVLGIEAARRTIIREMKECMGGHGIAIDNRHLMLQKGD